jgi:hypothetical protein
MRRYLDQIACILRPNSVKNTDQALRAFAGFLVESAPEVSSTAQVTRRHIEDYKPWLAKRPGQRTTRVSRGITWLDAQVIRQYSNAVSSGERHILALVEALALGKLLEDVGGLMASLDPYHLDLVLAVLRHAGCGSGPTRNSSKDAAAGWLG